MAKRGLRQTYHLRDTYRKFRKRGKSVAEAGRLAKRYVELLEVRRKFPLMNFAELSELAANSLSLIRFTLLQLERAEKEMTDRRPEFQKEIIVGNFRFAFLGEKAKRTKLIIKTVSLSNDLESEIKQVYFPKYKLYSETKRKYLDDFIQRNSSGFAMYASGRTSLETAIDQQGSVPSEAGRLMRKFLGMLSKRENMMYLAAELTRLLEKESA